MQICMDIGGARFDLDPAAVSALRYRVRYGSSVVNDLSACRSGAQAEGVLLRMCHAMIPDAQRPSLEAFAQLAKREPRFLEKAAEARDALLASDPLWHVTGEADAEPFDECRVLALMAAAHLDASLLFAVPLLYLASITARCFQLLDAERTAYRKLDAKEMAQLYPR